MSKNQGSNKENYEKTAKKFLKIARKEFIEHGFAHASTERIVEKSGMARGSLYYHYGNKEGIFKEVYIQIVKELRTHIADAIKDIDDPLQALISGCNAFFEACRKPDVRVVMLIEGIASIPFSERIKILEEHLISILSGLIARLSQDGRMNDFPPHVLTMFIYGILAECGRSLEYTGSLEERIEEYKKGVENFLNKISN